MDVPRGAVRASSPGLHGGRDEPSGSLPGVRPPPGHGAQDAGLLGGAGLPAAESAPTAQPFDKLRRSLAPGSIDRILESDLSVPRKQRHTAKRIFERRRDEHGFTGQYTIVKDYDRERRRTQEMFVPLSHAPGHAQGDFGEAVAVIGGVERKAHCFVLDLPHSDGCFVKAYPRGDHRGLPGRHLSAFAFLGGVPQSIL